jgi:7-cyano-7-deazaguanine synthase in queuosine biosynthesis
MITNNLYKQIDIPKFYFADLAIPFDPDWKNIGINLSGGADSAMLAYILCSIIEQNKFDCEVHVITYQRCWRTRPWQIYNSAEVYQKIVELFPTIKFNRHVGYIPPELEWGAIGPVFADKSGKERSGDQIIVSSYNQFLMYQKDINAIFEGTSRNPDVEFSGRMPNREKAPEDAVLSDLVLSKDNKYALFPFRFVRKDWIVTQYKSLGLLDLYSTTRSCEGEFPELSHDNYTPGQYIPVCKTCFWCKERKWAEEKNDL